MDTTTGEAPPRRVYCVPHTKEKFPLPAWVARAEAPEHPDTPTGSNCARQPTGGLPARLPGITSPRPRDGWATPPGWGSGWPVWTARPSSPSSCACESVASRWPTAQSRASCVGSAHRQGMAVREQAPDQPAAEAADRPPARRHHPGRVVQDHPRPRHLQRRYHRPAPTHQHRPARFTKPALTPHLVRTLQPPNAAPEGRPSALPARLQRRQVCVSHRQHHRLHAKLARSPDRGRTAVRCRFAWRWLTTRPCSKQHGAPSRGHLHAATYPRKAARAPAPHRLSVPTCGQRRSHLRPVSGRLLQSPVTSRDCACEVRWRVKAAASLSKPGPAPNGADSWPVRQLRVVADRGSSVGHRTTVAAPEPEDPGG